MDQHLGTMKGGRRDTVYLNPAIQASSITSTIVYARVDAGRVRAAMG